MIWGGRAHLVAREAGARRVRAVPPGHARVRHALEAAAELVVAVGAVGRAVAHVLAADARAVVAKPAVGLLPGASGGAALEAAPVNGGSVKGGRV